jgi:hypothetical protein
MRRSLSLAALVVAMGCASAEEPSPTPRPIANPQGFSANGGSFVPSATASPIVTCEQAASAHAYVGCEFWPTVVANNVWSIFDYAVVVANGGTERADIDVSGNGQNVHATVDAGAVATIYLPWNAELKGPDSDACGRAKALDASVLAHGGAYHLVSSRPVTVHQFNALEYRGDGGPPGKSWDTCPGHMTACDASGEAIGCLSFSNDAALLLPQAALTGTYRVTGVRGWSHPQPDGTIAHVNGAYFAITATRDGTHVKVNARGTILAGERIAATAKGGVLQLTMDAGDVAELVGPADSAEDLSGSLVTADAPIQIVAGAPCIEAPIGTDSCDHVETAVFPAETWGKDYLVAVPTSANGEIVGHVVRLYGNRDGTKLVYAPEKPQGAPDTIDAGQVIDLGVVSQDFRVTADQELAVASFTLGAVVADTVVHGRGDPSMSLVASTAQFRNDYVFLAPNDYDASYADVIAEADAYIELDDRPLIEPRPIQGTGYVVHRVLLDRDHVGAHRLVADRPVSLQIVGYGAYTSYRTPGGLDLRAIAAPPLR